MQHVDVGGRETDAIDAVGRPWRLTHTGPDAGWGRVGHASHPVVGVVVVGSHGEAFPEGSSESWEKY